MTREEQIKKQADIYTDDASNYTEWSEDNGWSCINDIELVEKAFIEGAKWADANPKSPWISVEDDLPCNHQELMKNEYFTVRVFVFTDGKDIRTDSMVKESSGWKWVNADFNYIYWMLMPELPKE